MQNQETQKEYAIIKTGGKQYRVAVDDIVEVEGFDHDKEKNVEFDVLFVNDGHSAFCGKPTLSDYTVKGEVLGLAAGPKISCIKYKARCHQYRRIGHRQFYLRVKIKEIAKKQGRD